MSQHQKASDSRALVLNAPKEGLVSKSRKRADGARVPGTSFSRGALYHLLANPIYLGKIRHKEEVYDGLHDAIIEEDVWNKVQNKLASQRVIRRTRNNIPNASPLAGKVFDQTGEPLTPSHANKDGKRYRYYISKGLNPERGAAWRLSASALEEAVLQAMAADAELQFHSEKLGIQPALDHVASVNIEPNQLNIIVCYKDGSKSHHIEVPYQLRRRGVEMKMVLQGQASAEPDLILIKRILKAMDWIDRLKAGDTISKIAGDENITPGHITHHIDLGFVSPKILKANTGR
jgi:hypothetical protein